MTIRAVHWHEGMFITAASFSDRSGTKTIWTSAAPSGCSIIRSLTLALRVNDSLIAGNIQGQRVLTIETGRQTTTLQFTLYVVPQESK